MFLAFCPSWAPASGAIVAGRVPHAPDAGAMQHNFNTKPPPNYVAGLGRGATGFTTRSDIGPARMLPGSELGAASAAGPARAPPAGQPADKPQDLSETKFDHFNGYEERLFGDTPYEEDDKLADEVWQAVDAQLDKRRKARREAREQEELKKFRATRPKLQHQFCLLYTSPSPRD